jgi:hypothetical protein
VDPVVLAERIVDALLDAGYEIAKADRIPIRPNPDQQLR